MKNPDYERCAKCGVDLPDEHDRCETRVIRHERRMKHSRYCGTYEIKGSETILRVVLCANCLDGAKDAVRSWIGAANA